MLQPAMFSSSPFTQPTTMISAATLLVLLFLFTALPPPAAAVTTAQSAPERLRSAEDLAGLYSLRGSLSIRSRDWPWKADPCSSWIGVGCRFGRVVSLDLTGLRRTSRGRLSPRFAVDGVRNLTALERFAAAGFPLPGDIPFWLGGSAAGLRVLSFSGNSITGNIPPTLGDLGNLSFLDLSGNFLSGSIPPELAALRNLSYLNLSYNFLYGVIPPSLGSLSRLKTLLLAGNSLDGAVPAQLGEFSLIESLDLSSNSLSGALPVEIFSGKTHLLLVNLSRNNFSGALPNSTWLLSKLNFFDVSSNNLTGVLPDMALRNTNAAGGIFNLSYNLYYGLLSHEIGLFFRRFNAVDLSSNYFEGSETIGNNDKNIFLKLNCFSDAMSQRSYGVCGNFYKERGVPYVDHVAPAPSPDFSSTERKSIHRWKYILAGALGGLSVLIAACLLILFCLKRCITGITGRGDSSAISVVPEERQLPPSPNGMNSPGKTGESFTYEQLVQATSNFSSMNLIKHGHSGDLYHGILKEGISVVVKRVDVHMMRREAHLVEMDLFPRDFNGRLVPSIGHCFEKENEKFLIYKFMPHWDLSRTLHKSSSSEEEELQSLDWITRLKIATEVAEALCFLHHECNPPMIHRDIHSSSILLDDKYEVHLGSLSEVCAQEGDNHLNAIGRILRRSQASEQVTSGSPATCAYDIYCFGKVLLELITGKVGISSSTDAIATEWLDHTLSHINTYEKDLIAKVIDPTLVVDEDHMEEVWAMAIIARCCLTTRPHKRPLARHLVKALQNPLKVVRDDSFRGFGPLMSTSSRGSWIGAFIGSWRQSSSEIASVSGLLRRDHSVRQASTARSQGSWGDHSFSRNRASREVFPEPIGTSVEVDE